MSAESLRAAMAGININVSPKALARMMRTYT
jgi:hypothetical protein